MKTLIGVLLLFLICLSAGCAAQYYYQGGKSFEECKKAREDCLRELAKYTSNPTYSEYEFKFIEECMKSKGYRLIKEDKLPLRVKREDPDYLRQWKDRRIRGIAGNLEEE